MIPNVTQLTQQLRMLPDAILRRVAQMYKQDPYIFPMVISEDMARKKLRASAQAQAIQPQLKVNDQALMAMGEEYQQPIMAAGGGLLALKAPNMERMADGGIAGYDDMATYAEGGNVVMAPGSTPSYQRTAMSPGMLDFAQRSEPVVRMAGGGVPGYAAGTRVRDFESLIRSEAQRQGVDPDIALRMFMTETGGEKDATTAVSKKGATGLGQLMKTAAKEMGLSPEERTDPVKNIQASVGYLKKQLDRYGSYDKALAAYNYGPGNLDKHLARNAGKLNRTGLPQETADYLTKILPVGTATAQAAKAPPGVPTPVPAGAQIPGQTVQAPAAVPEGFFSRLGSDLGMSEETKRNVGNILMAPTPMGVVTAPAKVPGELTGIRKLYENVSRFFGPPSAARKLTPEEIAAMQRATQSEAQAAQAAQAAQSATRTAQESGATVEEAAYLADLARRTEAAKAAKAAADRVPSAAEHLQLLQQAERARDAARATQVVSPSVAAAQTAKNVAAGAAAMTPGTTAAPVAAKPKDQGVLTEEYLEPTEKDKKTALDTAKDAIPKKERKGLTNDDLLEIGLRMMADPGTTAGGVLSALAGSAGRAGLGALAARREREKAEREEAKELSEEKYRAALTRKAEAEAGVYESGTKGSQAALNAANTAFKNWESGLSAMDRINLTEEQRNAKYDEFLRKSFMALGLTVPAGLSSQPTGAAKRLMYNPQTGKIE